MTFPSEYLQETIMLKMNRMKDVHMISSERVDDSQTNEVVTVTPDVKKSEKSEKSVGEINITAMSIITSVTFAAAFQVPGGYDGDTGNAVLINNGNFRWFLAFDSLAFGASCAAMVIHYLRTKLQDSKYAFVLANRKESVLSVYLTLASLTSMVFAFSCGTFAVLEEKEKFRSLVFLSGSYSFFIPLLLCYLISIGMSRRNSSIARRIKWLL
jgi:hypothetical protein